VQIDRRALLAYGALLPLVGSGSGSARAAEQVASEKPDYTLRIATGPAELAPDHIVSTTLYNGQFPGPLLRFKEGQRTVVDVYNETDTPELVHWHGQIIPSDVAGSRSCPSRLDSASITRTSWPATASVVAPTPTIIASTALIAQHCWGRRLIKSACRRTICRSIAW
jgi:hypothetical protein